MMSDGNKNVVKLDTSYITNLLHNAIELNASDIHITQAKLPSFRIDGKLTEMVSHQAWDLSMVNGFLQVVGLKGVLDKQSSVDSSFTLKEKRFRLHAYRSFSGITIALRIIPLDMPKFDTLNLPESVKKLVKSRSGLVLVTGATGSGKSTTLASLIDLVNNDPEDRKLVVTIENPVEFIHQEVNARIVQREVGKNVDSFEDAVKDALREDPDVILIGELQDREAIRNAITLAETGHLVLGSLHTNGAAEAFDRIVDAFPGDQQTQVRSQLTNSLQGVVHQTLVPRNGGGRVPLVEVLDLSEDDARRRIRKDSKLSDIVKLMDDNAFAKTMITAERSALDLINRGLITKDVALKYGGIDPLKLQQLLNANNRR